jgi:RNA polymerase sigma factor (sigma-70 family)
MSVEQPQLLCLSDETLVKIIQHNGFEGWCLPSAVLWERYQEWIDCLLGRRARRHRLPDADREDARQEAAFGFLKAIRRYDTFQTSRRGICSFQTFLSRVLTNQLTDTLRRRRWVRQRRRAARLVEGLVGGDADPVRSAQQNELRVRVQEIRGQLEDQEVGLLDGLLAGRRLGALAVSLGLSYNAVQRRWWKLRRRLAARLWDWGPEAGEKRHNSPPAASA